MSITNERKKIGIIGGGQLGMMLIEYGCKFRCGKDMPFIRVIDTNPEKCSCASIKEYPGGLEIVQGDLYDEEALINFAKDLDVITIEIEHISIDALKKIQEIQPHTEFIPSIQTLEIIQNKLTQKNFYNEFDIPTAKFEELRAGQKMFYYHLTQYLNPDNGFIWKSNTMGYDGKGVKHISSRELRDVGVVFDVNGILEDKVSIKDEVSIIILKTREGDMIHYEPTKMHFVKDKNILDYYTCYHPEQHIYDLIVSTAKKAVSHLNGSGLFAVEMFITSGSTSGVLANEVEDKLRLEAPSGVLVNEIAPRPHNSCHHTIHTHQLSNDNAYELLSKLILGEEIDNSKTINVGAKHFVTKNILGGNFTGDYEIHLQDPKTLCKITQHTNTKIIDYHKHENRPNRKIGHATKLAISHDDVDSIINMLNTYISIIPKDGVGIVMGSTSDWIVMKEACLILDELGIPYTKTVVSAHRTPQRLYDFASNARDLGYKVIIAGAGGAAHLPGMIASITELPVIGVPIKTSTLNGIDSLYSIVQMPAGVPVATVSINGAKNAGILAAQILGNYDKVRTYKDKSKDTTIENANNLML